MESVTKMANRPAYSETKQWGIVFFIFVFCVGVALIVLGAKEAFSKKTDTDDQKSVLKFRLILCGVVILLIGLGGFGLTVY